MTKERMDGLVLDSLRYHGGEIPIDVAPTAHGRLLRRGVIEIFIDRAGQRCVRIVSKMEDIDVLART